MHRRLTLLALAWLATSACGEENKETPDAGQQVSQDAATAADMGSSADAGETIDMGVAMDASVPDMGPQRHETLTRLENYLSGDFDNLAQFNGGFPQYVERHTCKIPGFPESPEVLWLYVEHVEHVTEGRDAYFIRINEVRMQGDQAVSKAYRFPIGHMLRTNAFAFNGARDACYKPELFAMIKEADLEYRNGCDVTFTVDQDRFSAISQEQTCTFPGGWIQTMSTVFENGLDSTDRAVTSQGSQPGATFEFRRVDNFTVPGS